MMSIPPVVRLSQALYNDVPSPAQSRSGGQRASPGRTASLATAASIGATETNSRPACMVRLLLPRTFAVADHSYHESLLTAGGGAVRERAPEHLVRGDAVVTKVQQNLVGIETTVGAQDEPDGNGGSSSCGTAASPVMNNGICTSSQQRACSIQSSATVASGGAALVVVESVLAFSAVQSLLDRSHAENMRLSASPSTAGNAIEPEQPPGDDPPHGCAGTAGPTDVCSLRDAGTDGNKSFGATRCSASYCSNSSTGGVSAAVGRLVAWLRIAAATTGLQERGRPGGFNSSGSVLGGSTSACASSVVETAMNARRTDRTATGFSMCGLDVDDDLLLAAAVATAGGRAHGTRYKVTGRCDGGERWIAFDLEPTAGPPGQTPEGGDRGNGAAGEVLQVRLICHPLVTMVPDIRWCLQLISQAKAFATLLNANAKLSTLGGGYFLTRQVGQAIRLALAQSEVATALGDLQLAGKCRVNVAYNYIWLGQYDEAQRIINAQVAASRAIQDEELENIASIAGRFLKRSRRANQRLLQSQLDAASGGGSRGDEGAKNGAGQGWVRQRIDVRTDEWHRVRALPLYCSSGRATPVGLGGEANRGQRVAFVCPK
ncbi:unnamed protein product [Ectocarpus sp. 12 AP-2014]